MAKGLSIEVEGLSKTLDQLNKYRNGKVKAISDELKATAFDIEADAKVAAPVDLGGLRQNIRVFKVERYSAEIASQADYSAYIEFGTGALVDVPKGLEAYAMQFKGKGIRQVNLPARPFLYPAAIKNAKAFVENIKKILNR